MRTRGTQRRLRTVQDRDCPCSRTLTLFTLSRNLNHNTLRFLPSNHMSPVSAAEDNAMMDNDRLDIAVNLVVAMLLAIAWAFVVARVFVRIRDRTRGADDLLMVMGLV
jgi:hypothetical protein